MLSGATLKHFKDAQGEDDGDLEGSVNVGTFTSIVEKKTNRNYGFAIEVVKLFYFFIEYRLSQWRRAINGPYFSGQAAR